MRILFVMLSFILIFGLIGCPDDKGKKESTTAVAEVTTQIVCGDLNSDAVVDSSDVRYFIEYLFNSGPKPTPEWVADVDGSGRIDLIDVDYLISYLYREGPLPVCLK